MDVNVAESPEEFFLDRRPVYMTSWGRAMYLSANVDSILRNTYCCKGNWLHNRWPSGR